MSYTDVFGGSAIQPSEVEFSALALAANTATFWPSFATTGQVLARIMKVSASAPALAVTLPDARLVGIGQDVLFDNAGAEEFSVLSFDGSVVSVIAPGQVKYLYLSSNTLPAGVWRVTAFGAAASALDASQLAGAGVKAIGSSLNQSMPLVTVSADQVVDATFRAVTYASTGAGVTYALPSSAAVGNNFFFVARNQGSGVLTLATTGGELIDGLMGLDLQLDESCFVVAGTGAWYTVGRGRNPQFNFTQLAKVVTGGNVTLTLSEASNVVQSYSGVLTSNCVVTLPAVVQVYYIANVTSGPFTLTFKAPVPGTVFVLPANQSAVVFCNGTNVTNTTTTISGVTALLLSAGTVSTPTLAFVAIDNGFYAPTSSSVALANGGVEVVRWSGGQQQMGDGLPSAPGYSFASNLGLGIYRQAANVLGFSTASMLRLTLGPAGNLVPAAAGTQDLGSNSLPWGSVYATTYNGAGAGLTGTAAALSIGGNAATATSAGSATTATYATSAGSAATAATATTAGSATTATYATSAGSAATATTQSPGDNTTNIATTAFVLANAANLNSPAFTGIPTAPTAAPGNNTTQLATTAFVTNLAFTTALPNQAGNSGKVPTTDGTTASWADVRPINGNSILGSAINLTLQDSTGKDALGGYAGLTAFKLNLKNAAGTFTNFLVNATTAARTWTMPDKDGTVAMLDDVALQVIPINSNTTAQYGKSYVIYGACTLTAPAISGNGKQFGIVVLPGVTGAIFAPAGADKTRGASGSQSIDAPFSAILTDSGATYGWI